MLRPITILLQAGLRYSVERQAYKHGFFVLTPHSGHRNKILQNASNRIPITCFFSVLNQFKTGASRPRRNRTGTRYVKVSFTAIVRELFTTGRENSRQIVRVVSYMHGRHGKLAVQKTRRNTAYCVCTRTREILRRTVMKTL